MKFSINKILHSITLRIPQKIALRNGLSLTTFNTADNSLFWSIFTSKEYLSFIPYIIKSEIKIKQIVDCGAACGYFSLLIEHLCRSRVFSWEPTFICIEPMKKNFRKLKINFEHEIFYGRVSLINGAIGNKTGVISFFSGKDRPWSSSINNRKGLLSNSFISKYIDISYHTKSEGTLLKLDIEGSEFNFLHSYKNDLSGVVALIIEWHSDEGDVEAGRKILESNDFVHIYTSLETENRIVELYFKRQKN